MSPELRRHEAFLYSGTDAFITQALRFLDRAVAAHEPALVMTDGAKEACLRAALGGRAGARVEFADMAVVGRNPARIIPAWQAFANAYADCAVVWGIGEPVWPGRTEAELVECRHHEALLNLAFADRSRLVLLCPYDTANLSPDIIDAARATHPTIACADGQGKSTRFDAVSGTRLLAEPLPPPPVTARRVDFGGSDLVDVRSHVTQAADAAGIGPDPAREIVLAVHEVAANSQRYGGGPGVLLTWTEAGLVCEVRDAGLVTDPLVGRRRPDPRQHGGRGLWLANQLCDLLQLRSSWAGTVVRLHKRADPVGS